MRTLFVLLALVACSSPAEPGVKIAARSFPAPQLSPAQTQADFDLMRKALEEDELE